VVVPLGEAPWSAIPIEQRVESFAEDLNTQRGIVSGRVIFLPRSTETNGSTIGSTSGSTFGSIIISTSGSTICSTIGSTIRSTSGSTSGKPLVVPVVVRVVIPVVVPMVVQLVVLVVVPLVLPVVVPFVVLVAVRLGEAPWSAIPNEQRVESFADDLNTRRDIVSGSVALLPQYTETSGSTCWLFRFYYY